MNWKKNEVESIDSRLDQAEEKICAVKYMSFGITQSGKNKGKIMTSSEEKLHELWDTIKKNNLHIIRVPEREERDNGTESLFIVIMIENFPNLGRDLVIQIHENHRSPKVSTPNDLLQNT